MLLLAITGGPRVGKTALSETARGILGGAVLHTDALIGGGWKEQPQLIMDASQRVGITIVEGVQVARALRKGLRARWVIHLGDALVARTVQQENMAKGIETIVSEVARVIPVYRFTMWQAEQFLKDVVSNESG